MKTKIFLLVSLASFFLFSATLKAENVYTIYPVPQEQVSIEGVVSFTSKVNVVCDEGIDDVTRKRVQGIFSEKKIEVSFSDSKDASCTNIYLGVHNSGSLVDQLATNLNLPRDIFSLTNKYDNHLLSLYNEGNNVAQVVILGEDTDAVFYGLASLEQMIDNATENLPCVSIFDYADQQSRGLVEGYYGYPYTIAVKKDLMKFMMRHKMNTYMYGVKGDPYHSEHWTAPYPTSITAEQEKNGWLTQDMIKDLTQTAKDTKVNFVWAIHPGNNFTNSSTVINDIMGKFDKMYQLGVRQFAVFVDDVNVPEDAATHTLNANRVTQLQQALENKYNKEGVAPADTVKPLHFVPQVYASSFVGEAVRRSFFQALSKTPKNVTIYTTGWGVWSVPNSSDLNVVKQDLGRDVAWWWNYPCNDNADGQLYTMDMYSNFYDMPSVGNNATLPSNLEHGVGIVSNPMQEGEVSKTALFSVADYAWNNSGFNNKNSWEASYNYIVKGDNVAAYRKLAEYLRYNDPENLNKLITTYKASLKAGRPVSAELKAEMKDVYEACVQLETLKDSKTESDRLLYNDLAPWLLKLKQMTSSVCNLLDVADVTDNNVEKWNKYAPEVELVEKLKTEEAYKAYALEGMGSWTSVSVRISQPSELYLCPFVTYLKENVLGEDFFGEKLSDTPQMITNINTEGKNIGNVQSSKGVVNLYIPQPIQLKPEQYIGISLSQAVKLRTVAMTDTLYANYDVLYSENGKIWNKFEAANALPEEYVKYVCVKNVSNEIRPFRALKSTLQVTLPTIPEISKTTGPSGNVYDNNTISNMVDGDYNTFYILNRNQQHGDAYMLTLRTATQITDVRICLGTTNDDYMQKGRAQISTDGKTWTNLRVKGTTRTDFNMSMSQVVKYSDNMSYLDFEGDNKDAKYVRLLVETANTNKWLRLAEIEVNHRGYLNSLKPICQDKEGLPIYELTDAYGYTSMAQTAKDYFLYNLLQLNPTKELIVYRDVVSNPAVLTVHANEQDGTWQKIAELSQAYNIIDLAGYEQATQLKFEWDTATPPAVYEIQEVVDLSQQPVVSGIEENIAMESLIKISAQNHQMNIVSAKPIILVELYELDGHLIEKKNFNSVSQANLQLPQQRLLIAKVVYSDGSSNAYKLKVK
ncbi:MAG: beta-N-acetylglucosaminidase domain-containing protein [Bacteroidaceae bacterium]|nr:beta-N-acetylglucosaminidase domain-containing protein [Bacteroidaceae bacterium]